MSKKYTRQEINMYNDIKLLDEYEIKNKQINDKFIEFYIDDKTFRIKYNDSSKMITLYNRNIITGIITTQKILKENGKSISIIQILKHFNKYKNYKYYEIIDEATEKIYIKIKENYKKYR